MQARHGVQLIGSEHLLWATYQRLERQSTAVNGPCSGQRISARHGIHLLVCEPNLKATISPRHSIQLLVSEPCSRQRISARHGIQRWCRPCSGAGGDSSSSFCGSSCSARHSSCSGQDNRAYRLEQVVKDVRVLPCFSVALYPPACL